MELALLVAMILAGGVDWVAISDVPAALLGGVETYIHVCTKVPIIKRGSIGVIECNRPY